MAKSRIADFVHPAYKANAARWERWQAAYYGGAGYVQQALESHRLENSRDFVRRLERATLLNYVRPICDTYANYLFRPAWKVELPPGVGFLARDADRRGTPLLDFAKSLLPIAAAVGFAPIGVDEPAVTADEVPRNLAERAAMGVRPYLYFIDPLDLRDWDVDADGTLTMALVRERSWRRRAGGEEKEGATIYRLWTAERCVMLDERGTELGEVANRAGVVPIVALKFRDVGDPIIGQGLGQDLEPIQAHILNLSSLLSEVFFRQTFSQLVAEGSAEEYGENGDIARLGTASIFLYPEGRKPPGYISPDASQARLLMEQIDRAIDEIYRLANLSRGSVRDGAKQSGISKAYDFLDTNQALSDVARNTAGAMTAACRLAARWLGDAATDEIAISQPADFGVVDLDGDVTRLRSLVEAGASPTLIKALEDRIGRTMFPQ
jgi:hypothetical protein